MWQIRKGQRRKRCDWYDNECDNAVKERNYARMKLVQRRMRATSEEYKRKRANPKSFVEERRERNRR